MKLARKALPPAPPVLRQVLTGSGACAAGLRSSCSRLPCWCLDAGQSSYTNDPKPALIHKTSISCCLTKKQRLGRAELQIQLPMRDSAGDGMLQKREGPWILLGCWRSALFLPNVLALGRR